MEKMLKETRQGKTILDTLKIYIYITFDSTKTTFSILETEFRPKK
jgi:hypothetical protein